MPIDDIKFNTNLYQNNFMATEKQKDFIIDNSYVLDDELEEKVLTELNNGNLTKKDAGRVIQRIIDLLDYMNEDLFDDFNWK